MALSNANLTILANAANLMIVETALELPFDAKVAETLAPVAVSSGFAASTGQFLRAVQLKPVSTMILFVAFVGGSGVVLPKQA
jgi:hypothetical protein